MVNSIQCELTTTQKKGLKTTHANTVIGEMKFKRAIYEIKENEITKALYLLDEKLKINTEGNVSNNLYERNRKNNEFWRDEMYLLNYIY